LKLRCDWRRHKEPVPPPRQFLSPQQSFPILSHSLSVYLVDVLWRPQLITSSLSGNVLQNLDTQEIVNVTLLSGCTASWQPIHLALKDIRFCSKKSENNISFRPTRFIRVVLFAHSAQTVSLIHSASYLSFHLILTLHSPFLWWCAPMQKRTAIFIRNMNLIGFRSSSVLCASLLPPIPPITKMDRNPFDVIFI
jgi:hypothetical protein